MNILMGSMGSICANTGKKCLYKIILITIQLADNLKISDLVNLMIVLLKEIPLNFTLQAKIGIQHKI